MEVSTSNFFTIVFFGIAPSILWLLYYLRKDVHPEPKGLILQLFLIGFLLPPFVGFVEIFAQDLTSSFLQTPLSYIFLIAFAALWEEGTKYLAARSIFHHEKEFDELTDAMIYLVVVALGFAASENIIIALSSFTGGTTENIFTLLALRGVGATLLHTLASGILGYFLARSIFLKERFSLLKGFAFATIIHTLFNILVLKTSSTSDSLFFTLLVIILLISGMVIILKDFYKLKQYDE